MPNKVIDIYFYWNWKRVLGSHNNSLIWNVNTHCIMWTIWRELNNQTFEGVERFAIEIFKKKYDLLDSL